MKAQLLTLVKIQMEYSGLWIFLKVGVSKKAANLLRCMTGLSHFISPIALTHLLYIFFVAESIFTFHQIMTPYQDVLQEDDTQWAFAQIPALEKSLSVMDGEPLQEVVKEVIGLYKTHVQPNLCLFQRGNSANR